VAGWHNLQELGLRFGDGPMKKGDLVKIIKSGQVVVYLGTDDNGCYKFWHHKWQMCYFAPDNFPPDKYEIINAV